VRERERQISVRTFLSFSEMTADVKKLGLCCGLVFPEYSFYTSVIEQPNTLLGWRPASDAFRTFVFGFMP